MDMKPMKGEIPRAHGALSGPQENGLAQLRLVS